uniref:Uncharacterized protein n=1 Tax=Vespula pensylvanica TaxID=30213 RepID=A0A834K4M7_VESPE|nr:hypothetical protein H0235_016332 [Vespula pensylvanica]
MRKQSWKTAFVEEEDDSLEKGKKWIRSGREDGQKETDKHEKTVKVEKRSSSNNMDCNKYGGGKGIRKEEGGKDTTIEKISKQREIQERVIEGLSQSQSYIDPKSIYGKGKSSET